MFLLLSEYMSEWASELVRKWVFYVNQTAHAMSRRSFGQSLDPFCFSLFAFRFSLFAFRFSLFAFRSQVCVMLLLLSAYMNVWVSEWVSELKVSEWVFYVNQTAHPICRRSFGQSQDSFCFSLFVFRFSLFDNRSASCFYCLVSEYMSEWVCKWVS